METVEFKSMMSSGMNLVTTIIGFGMSATFIVFVCTRILCGRIRGGQSGPMLEIESRNNDLEQPEQQNIGLDSIVVAAIPTMRFNREAFTCLEDAQCSICLGEYQEKEELRIMPKCGHNFHLACIDVWLRKQSTCLVCRYPLHSSFHVEAKQLRSATSRTVQSADHNSQISGEHSHQWLSRGQPDSISTA